MRGANRALGPTRRCAVLADWVLEIGFEEVPEGAGRVADVGFPRLYVAFGTNLNHSFPAVGFPDCSRPSCTASASVEARFDP